MKHECSIENAPKFAEWIKNRGGIAVWKSQDLGNPGQSWSTPALLMKGTEMGDGTILEEDRPYPSPHWSALTPEIVTDPAQITVYAPTEVDRFRVALRQRDMRIECTDASTRKIRQAVDRIGKGAFYEFDYSTQEAVIYVSKDIMTLKEWMETNP